MVKGVYKRVVEVNEMENDYFERAILVVRPEKNKYSEEKLKSKADEYVKNLGSASVAWVKPSVRGKKERIFRWLGRLACVLLGALITACLMII